MENKALKMEEEEVSEYKIGGKDEDWSKALTVMDQDENDS